MSAAKSKVITMVTSHMDAHQTLRRAGEEFAPDDMVLVVGWRSEKFNMLASSQTRSETLWLLEIARRNLMEMD